MRTIIIGGVAGGMSAATRLRRLDESAEIIVLERSGYVSFANCGLPYHLGGVIQDRAKLLVAKPEMFKKRFNIEVRVRHEALSIDRARKTVRIRDHGAGTEYDESYDKLILAPGAAPLIPDVPGVRAQGVRRRGGGDTGGHVRQQVEARLDEAVVDHVERRDGGGQAERAVLRVVDARPIRRHALDRLAAVLLDAQPPDLARDLLVIQRPQRRLSVVRRSLRGDGCIRQGTLLKGG